jgi:hypothetical protein
MSYRSFWRLHDKLKDSIIQSVKDATISRKHARRQLQRYQRRGGAPRNPNPTFVPPPSNGEITTSVRLACALWYFAGGSPYNIMTNYGISHSEALDSVWYVVDVVGGAMVNLKLELLESKRLRYLSIILRARIQKRDQFPPIFLPSHIDGASPKLQLKNTPKSSIGILNGIPQTNCMPIRPM